MCVEQVVRHRDVLALPPLPVTGLVTGDEQDGLALGIEREQDPQLAAPGRAWPQLLHVAVP